jgi:hypothetical protein
MEACMVGLHAPLYRRPVRLQPVAESSDSTRERSTYLYDLPAYQFRISDTPFYIWRTSLTQLRNQRNHGNTSDIHPSILEGLRTEECSD